MSSRVILVVPAASKHSLRKYMSMSNSFITEFLKDFLFTFQSGRQELGRPKYNLKTISNSILFVRKNPATKYTPCMTKC